MRVLDATLSPIRSIGRVLFATHWFFTILSAIFISGFVVILFHLLPEYALPNDRSRLPSPSLLGAGAVLFTLAAIASWIVKYRPDEFTDEQREEMRRQRLAEIESWLVRPLTVDEVHEMLAADYDAIGHRHEEPEMYAAFDDWFTRNASTEDELWYYDTGEESWANLCGENGFALVRDGRVVEFEMWFLN